jgi:hypothetical protein
VPEFPEQATKGVAARIFSNERREFCMLLSIEGLEDVDCQRCACKVPRSKKIQARILVLERQSVRRAGALTNPIRDDLCLIGGERRSS